MTTSGPAPSDSGRARSRASAGSVAADALAGVALAAYMIPAALGDASLAHLPAQAGLYACIFAGLVYGWLCSARLTTVTVTSAISLLVGSTLGPMASADPARMAALASATALLVGVIALVARVVRAGSLVSFVSETVLLGFKIGVALVLASTQLPKLLGMSPAHGNFEACVAHLVTHLDEINPASVLVGATALAVVLVGKALTRTVPVALIVVVAGIVASRMLGLEQHGVRLLGEVPAGLPALGLPRVGMADLNELLPLALACFLLGAVETTAIGRMFAFSARRRLDANREFLALAAANFAAGVGQGCPVSGGMSQSLVNQSAGARTPLSGIVAAGIMLVVALSFTELLSALPQPVLAAIVLTAVLGLVNVSAVKHLWRTDRGEFLIAATALAGVLASGLLRGVLIGAVISMILVITRASRPHVAVLGRIPGTRRFSDRERHPENGAVAGVLIVRPEGSLLYFNAEYVREVVEELVESAGGAVRGVVIDLSASPYLDMAGAQALKALGDVLRPRGVEVHMVEARSGVRERLRLEGVDEHAGRIDRFTSVTDAVEAIAGPIGDDAGTSGGAASGPS